MKSSIFKISRIQVITSRDWLWTLDWIVNVSLIKIKLSLGFSVNREKREREREKTTKAVKNYKC